MKYLIDVVTRSFCPSTYYITLNGGIGGVICVEKYRIILHDLLTNAEKYDIIYVS